MPCPEGTAVETDELQASDSDTVLLLDKSRHGCVCVVSWDDLILYMFLGVTFAHVVTSGRCDGVG